MPRARNSGKRAIRPKKTIRRKPRPIRKTRKR